MQSVTVLASQAATLVTAFNTSPMIRTAHSGCMQGEWQTAWWHHEPDGHLCMLTAQRR